MNIDGSGVELGSGFDYSGPDGSGGFLDADQGVDEMVGFDLGRGLNIG